MDKSTKEEVKLFSTFDKFINISLSKDNGKVARLFREDKVKRENKKWLLRKLDYCRLLFMR